MKFKPSAAAITAILIVGAESGVEPRSDSLAMRRDQDHVHHELNVEPAATTTVAIFASGAQAVALDEGSYIPRPQWADESSAFAAQRLLGYEVAPPTPARSRKSEVALRQIEWSLPGLGCKFVSYEVENLRSGGYALVADFGPPSQPRWRVLPVRAGVEGSWRGEYASAEDALSAIQSIVKI